MKNKMNIQNSFKGLEPLCLKVLATVLFLSHLIPQKEISMTSQFFDEILRQNLIFNERHVKETSSNRFGVFWDGKNVA